MATIRDLARRGAILVLARLGRGEPISMAEFTHASGLVPDRSKVLREALEAVGLIGSLVAATRGAQSRYEIRLTPLGRAAAEHIIAIEDLFARHEARST